jgi:hypothetical protein
MPAHVAFARRMSKAIMKTKQPLKGKNAELNAKIPIRGRISYFGRFPSPLSWPAKCGPPS